MRGGRQYLCSVIEEHDPDWPRQYEEAAKGIREASDGEWLVEHIGSTAIEGLCAKPIIDLAVRVERLSDVEDKLPALEALGWRDIAAGPRTHRVLVRQRGDVRTHIAHFFCAEQWDTCNQRIFRDWLQEHADDRLRYETVKRAAATAGLSGRAYTAGKTAIVQEIVDRARTARGLPSVNVWDK
ncbi:GrpB family protein [Phytoactinopolyspora endophytica]|uniref:GrpB family protein n=1 Tax=Phytoactinopolyspora endophytica TaxID=1642495 RepID=UPI00101D3994|nr:GrpB family protein [Phytoactinopolyspora endophytica]